MTSTRSQTDTILAHLETGSGISAMNAFKQFGCTQLGARIWELRHLYNKDIRMDMVKHGKKRYGYYTLVSS